MVSSNQGDVRPPALDDEAMLEEENILAGCIDVNMPALLTKDVLGE